MMILVWIVSSINYSYKVLSLIQINTEIKKIVLYIIQNRQNFPLKLHMD